MKFSKKAKFGLISLIILINIILRFQVLPREIGNDSFLMHIMSNSISEFGYAKWVLHPLSFVGLYPISYTSTMHFLLSGISQSTGIEMDSTIFLYSFFLGLLSIFTAYLMMGVIINDDLIKLLAAFGFSTVPAVLNYSTWTIPTRGLFIILAPVLIYLLFKCRSSMKYIPLTFILAIFLFATHHLFYFLIPAFLGFFIIIIYFRFENYINLITIPKKMHPYFIIIGFILMFSIPFFTGRFIENSRYASIDFSYMRYVGVLIIPAIGGLGYLIFKHNKNSGEWLLLLTIIFLFMFVYQQTYMKSFMPIFLIPLACIGLTNIIRAIPIKKYGLIVIAIFLIISISFSGYIQFVNFLSISETSINQRYIEDSTYTTGRWIKNNAVDSAAISNDVLFGNRIFAESKTIHLLTDNTVVNNIYGFLDNNVSQFKRYSWTKEEFWFYGYEGPDFGQSQWEAVNMLKDSPYDLNIRYFIENKKANGNIIWNHKSVPSKLLQKAYNDGNLLYDNGNVRVLKF